MTPEIAISCEFEEGIPVFKPTYEKFKDFRSFVDQIEPIGMQTGIVKIIPPKEWIEKISKIPTAKVNKIEIKSPIIQNVTLGTGRGIFGVENIEKKRKYTIQQWIKQCNSLGNQPPMMRGEKQRILGKYEDGQDGFVSYDDNDYNPDMLKHLEAQFWKGLTYGGAPMYGADLPGSLFDDEVTHWNVANLDSLLSAIPDKIPGVNDAYLYCGMWKSLFAWHLEDMDLPSINYIHFGAPKQWYSIPQSHHIEFYNVMSALWPDEQKKCSEFLRHKTFLADPAFIRKQGIPVNQVVHRQHEFIITFPYGYHAGFNYGFNIAESVNFAHNSWLDIGTVAKKCTCVSHSVGIDVQSMFNLLKMQNDKDTKEPKNLPKPKRLGKCILCPHKYTGEYLSNRAGTALTHKHCANLIPETFIVGNNVLGLMDIPKDRFSLKCAYCKLNLGSCFQCSEKQCTRAFHGSCAAAAGVDFLNVHRPLCRTHRSHDRKPNVDPLCLIHGDVVQGFVNNSFTAGAVIKNQYEKKILHLSVLPDHSDKMKIAYTDVVAIYDARSHGPFVEPLIKSKTRKRTFDTKQEDDTFYGKRVKAEPQLGSSLLSPPKQLN